MHMDRSARLGHAACGQELRQLVAAAIGQAVHEDTIDEDAAGDEENGVTLHLGPQLGEQCLDRVKHLVAVGSAALRPFFTQVPAVDRLTLRHGGQILARGLADPGHLRRVLGIDLAKYVVSK